MRIRVGMAGLAAVVVGAAGVLFAAPASAATTHLWVVNAYSYNNTGTFDFTVCVDEVEVASLSTTELDGPSDIESGDHQVEVFQGLDTSCGSEADFSDTVTIPDTPDTTLMLFWPSDSSTVDVAVFADDLTCTEPGEARLLVRNGASTYNEGLQPTDVLAVDPSSAGVMLADAVVLGTEQASSQAPGTYTEVEAQPQAEGADPLDDLVLQEGVVTALYLYGGNDGDIGSFTYTSQAGACEDTTTTVAPTTTTTAAVAATATPRYAG